MVSSKSQELEQQMIEKSELAFQAIAAHLKTNNTSLRNALKNKLYDKKIRLIGS